MKEPQSRDVTRTNILVLVFLQYCRQGLRQTPSIQKGLLRDTVNSLSKHPEDTSYFSLIKLHCEQQIRVVIGRRASNVSC